MENNPIKAKLQVKHLVYLSVFLFTLCLRFYAAAKLNITQSEADILLPLTRVGASSGGHASLIYQLLTLPLMSFLGSGPLVVRFWLILAGALLTLVPLLFEDWLGERPALVLSVLLAPDPFASAASLQLNSGLLTLTTLVIAMGLLHRKIYFAGSIVLMAFLLTGRAILYPLGVGAILLLVLYLQKEMEPVRGLCRELWNSVKENIQKISVVLAGIVLAAYILRVPLSDSLNGILAMFANWGEPYALGNSPQLYPIALVSYLPLGLIGLLFPARSAHSRKLFPYILLVSLLAVILVMLNPNHQVLDLVWVSSPLWIAVAFNISQMVEKLGSYPGRIKIYTLIIICLLVSLSITVVTLIYQINYGLDMVGNLLAAISLLVMITLVVLFLAYNDTVPIALSAFRWGLLLATLTFQLAFSWRSMGLYGNPAGEILWGGYFEGADTVEDIIRNANLTTTGGSLDKSVGFIQPANSAVEWKIARNFKVEELNEVTIDQRLAVLVTDTRDGLSGNSADGYNGQDFNANSYPLWIWQPGRSLSNMDFWFWLFLRKGQIMRETDFVWLNKTIFVNSYWE